MEEHLISPATMTKYCILVKFKWAVGKKERRSAVRIRSDKGTNYNCPVDAMEWEYYHKTTYALGWTYQGWSSDSTLTVTCNQEHTTETTERVIPMITSTHISDTPPLTTPKSTDSFPRSVIIGGSVGGGVAFLFLVVIVSLCMLRKWKSRQSNPGNIDNNPVYGVYSDVYKESEIYDKNAYYAAADVEDGGTTMIRDNNSNYE